MYRFFVSNKEIENNNMVKITGSNFNHISRSLRLQQGDKIIVNTNDGQDYIVRLTNFSNQFVRGKIIQKMQNQNEPVLNLTLAQALPKNKNMELIIQKGTEIGLKKIIPLETERTVVKLSATREKKRIKRWQRIAREAAGQAQRGIIPQIDKVHNIENIIEINENYDLVFLYRAGKQYSDLKDIVNDLEKNGIKDILLLIGPEGGFSYREAELINNKTNAHLLSLGPRILRTETAALVALTTVLYEFGELRINQ